MSTPVVSVILPVYNAERYLAPAVESVLGQTFGSLEVIAVDDGSTDGSPAILDALVKRDSRLRVISRPNTGIVGALNDGIAAARGEFIARMDGDDLCLPERFAKQVTYLCEHPECVLVGAHVLRVDPAGLPIGPEDLPLGHDAILEQLLGGAAGTLTHPSIMVRKEALLAVGGYRPEYQWVEDYDLYLRLAEVGKLANLPETLLHYRLHHESVNMKKRDLQGDLAARCLSEACLRMGIPDRKPVAMLGWLARPRDPISTRRGWARRALVCGYFATARKHAWANFRAQPLTPAWWKLLALSILHLPRLSFRSRFRHLFQPKLERVTH